MSLGINGHKRSYGTNTLRAQGIVEAFLRKINPTTNLRKCYFGTFVALFQAMVERG